MHRYNMIVAGSIMVGAGAYLIFVSQQGLPLWLIWLVGPFLWYIGIAVSIVGSAFPLIHRLKETTPRRSSVEGVPSKPVVPSRQVPIEVLLLQIEDHVRLEQAAAESFLAFPTHAQLHSKTTSPFVN